MVENRKLFYAISVLLLSCCQIITMFPHNAADSELVLLGGISGSGSFNRIEASPSSNTSDPSNNSEYNRANVDSSSNQSYGNNDDDSEFIIAVERKHQQQQEFQYHHHHQTMANPNEGWNTGNRGVWEAPDSRGSENVDDLIFLDKRPINQYQQEQLQQQPQRVYVAQLPTRPKNDQQLHRHEHFEIHHHLSADGIDSDSSSSSSSTSDEQSDSLAHTTFASSTGDDVVAGSNKDDGVDDDLTGGEMETETVDADTAMLPHEIELQPNNNEEVSGGALTAAVTPLDLSDFLALIPAAKVKTIDAHYYRNDPEVQRAHAFLSSRDFISLKHHIIDIPEMSAFLRYLNSSGLDLVKFVTTLTNMTTVVSSVATTTEKGQMVVNATSTAFETNDIEYAQKPSETVAATIPMPTTAATPPPNIEIPTQTPIPASESATASLAVATTIEGGLETTTAKEQLNGLHGLVDSILDVLPQDQILATFFDKLESNEQFSKLIDNIGSPEFSKILYNMQNSVPLRNLIFTLHNNGIYVIRIVDSLKSYFFLGGF